jgi:Type II secretion system (T2SS), protein E, N-terminal domain
MPRLGDLLIEKTLITEEQRQRAVQRQVRQKGRLGTSLLEEEVSEEVILHGLSVLHRVPPASPEALEAIRADVLRLVPGRVAQRLHSVPFRKEGRSLAVAMRDPGDLAGLDELSALTGFRILPHAALEVRIYALLYRYYAADVEPRYLSAAAYLRETQPPPITDTDEPTHPTRVPRTKSRPELRVVPPPPPDLTSPYPQRARRFDQGDPWQSGSDLSPAASLAVTARRMENEIFEDPLESLDPEPDSMEFPRRLEDPAALPTEAGAGAMDAGAAGAAEAAEVAGDDLLIAKLAAAQNRDEIADVVLEESLRHVRRAALFVAHPNHVRGWASRPAAPAFASFQLPDSEPSVFATLRNTEGFYVGPQPDLPGTASTLRALESSGLGLMAVVPVNLKGKTVLYLYGEAESDEKPPPVPSLKRLAAMAATALEIVLLKRRLGRL